MRAIEFNKEIILNENYPEPELQDNEALIKVHLAGVCNTDLEIVKGYMGFSGVLGHEFVGRVIKVNGERQDLIGKRVVGEINCACGECELCLDNLKTHCQGRKVLGIYNKDGSFADYITLPLSNLIEIPDSVEDEDAVFIEPLAAAFEITEQAQIKPSDNVIVLGDGKLGLLVSFVLRLLQPNLLLAGKHKNKLEIAANEGIKTVHIDNLEINKSYDIVVEATGSASGFELAQNLVRPRGTIILKSTYAANKPINLAPLVIDEVTVIGSRCGPFAPALQALENKLINVKPLISEVYSFNNAKDAFEFSKSKGFLKALIDFT